MRDQVGGVASDGSLVAALRRRLGPPHILSSAVSAVFVVGLITLLLASVGDSLRPHTVAIFYLIPVALAATYGGAGTAVAVAAASAIAAAYFLYAPRYSLAVTDAGQLADLVLFGVVAAVLGHLVLRLRAHARIANARQEEIAALYQLSRRLAVSSTVEDIYGAIQTQLTEITRCRVVVLPPRPHYETSDVPSLPPDVPSDLVDELRGLADRSQGPVQLGDWTVLPLRQSNQPLGIVAVETRSDDPSDNRLYRRQVPAALQEAAATLERINAASAIAEARLRAEGQLLRQALVSSISHDLCTPLASILGSASILVKAEAVRGEPRLAALANVIHDEAGRLNSDIETLLNANQIASNTVVPRIVPCDVADIINASLDRRRHALHDSSVEVDIPEDLPLVRADPRLAEQALGQIIQNAARYARGLPLRVSARISGDGVHVAVADEGIGISADELSHVFDRGYRSPRVAAAIKGSGLGLWIAKSLANAGGAVLEASSPGIDRGSTFTLTFSTSQTEPGADYNDD